MIFFFCFLKNSCYSFHSRFPSWITSLGVWSWRSLECTWNRDTVVVTGECHQRGLSGAKGHIQERQQINKHQWLHSVAVWATELSSCKDTVAGLHPSLTIWGFHYETLFAIWYPPAPDTPPPSLLLVWLFYYQAIFSRIKMIQCRGFRDYIVMCDFLFFFELTFV